jgi:uncharacterized membrane protein YfcA
MDLVLRVVLGIAVGTVGTLVGTGGGWALVPIFLLGFHFTPQEAAGTSLAVVFFNAASGTVAYVRQKRIQYKAAVIFALATIPGAVVGSHLSNLLDRASFNTALAVFLLLVAATLLFRKPKDALGVDGKLSNGRLLAGTAVSLLVGVVSSVLGVGGGIIHVPFLVLVLGMGAHVATATSHFVLAVTAAAGVAGHAWEGHVRWLEALTVGGGAVVGAQLGARLSSVLPGRVIQRILGVLLVVFSLTLLSRGP